MEHKTKSCELLSLILASLLIVGAGVVETTGAAWVKSVNTTSYQTDDHLVDTQTKYESANAAANPGSSYSNCSADAAIESTEDDDAYAFALTTGVTIYIWGWDGPPGTSPSGFIDYAQDSADITWANGENKLSPPYYSGNAISSSSASISCSAGCGSETLWARSSAEGNATVGQPTTGDCSATAGPRGYYPYFGEVSTRKDLYDPLWYICLVAWQYYDDASFYFSGGSPYLMFVAQVQCNATAEGDAWPTGHGAEASANSTSFVSMSFSADVR